MTTESHELVTLTDYLPVVNDDCNILENSCTFLPYIKFCTSSSEVVKTEKINMNHYGLFKGSEIIDLGKEVDVVVLTRRPKAMDVSGEKPVVVYDMKAVEGKPTGEFARIMAASELQNSGCMFGLEYLVYIKELNVFATVHFSSKSNRLVAPKMSKLIGKCATLKYEFVDTGKFQYNTMTVIPCSDSIVLPDKESVLEEVTNFLNPPAPPVVEPVEAVGEVEER